MWGAMYVILSSLQKRWDKKGMNEDYCKFNISAVSLQQLCSVSSQHLLITGTLCTLQAAKKRIDYIKWSKKYSEQDKTANSREKKGQKKVIMKNVNLNQWKYYISMPQLPNLHLQSLKSVSQIMRLDILKYEIGFGILYLISCP